MVRPWRTWQIWLGYGVSLALAVLALSWLSGKVLELDRAEAAARARGELDERAGAALWRMDVELTHLLAAEVGRPVSAFQPVMRSGLEGDSPSVSPLLVQPSQYVLLHFQVDEQGRWVSPQVPDPRDNEVALANGATRTSIDFSQRRLQELRETFEADRLLARLPDEVFAYEDATLLATNSVFEPPTQTYIANAGQAAQAAQAQQQVKTQQQLGQLESRGRGAEVDVSPQGAGRAASEFNRRFNTLQTAAEQSLRQQRGVFMELEPPSVSLSRTQPFWKDGRLILARRVVVGDEQRAQGCWLDWPAIRQRLLESVSDLLPEADLAPVAEGGQTAPFNRLLASLPVHLVLPDPVEAAPAMTPIRLALLVSWGCFAAAAAAVGGLLHGVLKLSERRASFVSAVTHELRTPLTTFRMYSEMLSEGMVPPEQRQTYLETLRSEADRLSHLVENVLQYARLERSAEGWKITETPADQLLELAGDRLAGRAEQAGLQLELKVDPRLEGERVATNLAALEQILFNLIDNACKYATPSDPPRLDVALVRDGRFAEVVVRDYGPGVSAEQRHRLFQPFSRTGEVGPAPGVGLGLALCRRLASQLGARLQFQPQSPGAQFTLRLPLAES